MGAGPVIIQTIEMAFGAYLQTSSSIVSAVGTDGQSLPAIYLNRGLQDSQADPYISFSFPKNVPQQLVGGAPDVNDLEVTISCYSTNTDMAKSLAFVVAQFLQFLQFPVAFGATNQFMMLGHWVIDSFDSDEANDIGLFETIVQVGFEVQTVF